MVHTCATRQHVVEIVALHFGTAGKTQYIQQVFQTIAWDSEAIGCTH